MNPTRRQFLKQAAVTVAATVVAPSVLAGREPSVCKGFPGYKQQPYMKWRNYTCTYNSAHQEDAVDKMRVASKARPFKVPLGGWI